MSEEKVTFASLPDCPDLNQIQADIVVIGVPFGVPYSNNTPQLCTHAPESIRRESIRFPKDLDAWDFDLGNSLSSYDDVPIVDCGNVDGKQGDSKGNQERAHQAIKMILDAGAVPVVLGGDDSIPIPVLRAYEGRTSFHVLQFDANIDWRDEVDAIRDGYSSTMRRASELAWVEKIIQVGMRGVGSAREREYRDCLDYGAKLITARDISKYGSEIVKEYFPKGVNCFITLDFDVLDPSIMPAVGAPTPGGLNYIELIDLIQWVAENTDVVGVCLVEFAPERDLNNLGAVTAMRVVWNILGCLAESMSHKSPSK